MRHKNVSLTLAIVADCRRKQGDGTIGTREYRMAVAYIVAYCPETVMSGTSRISYPCPRKVLDDLLSRNSFFLSDCPANSAALSTLSRKFYRYKLHPMYCKRELLQRRCIRGCGFWVWLPVLEIFLVRLATMGLHARAECKLTS